MPIDTGVVADDLTGGLLVASFLEGEGIRCPLYTAPQAVPAGLDAPACVIARRIRLAPASRAVAEFEAAAAALAAHHARQIYYKYCATFDSTDEGNIGPCADALMRRTGADRLGFCPAFPAVGVTVYQGHIFLRDQLLSDSPKRFDPLTPMPDPNLVQVLGRQTARRVGLVPHGVLAAGRRAAEAHITALTRDGVAYLIFDAVDDDDVAMCARLTAGWPVMTGGDTLARMAPALRIGSRGRPAPLSRIGGPAAVIAGSCGPATLEQLDRFAAQRPVRRIDLIAAAADPDAAVAEALDWARPHLADGPVGIAVSDRPEGVARTQQALGRAAAARLGESLCAALAADLFQLGVRRFVVAGGETSGAVAEALGVAELDAAPPGPLGGGLCRVSRPEPMGLFFKAGKMGPPDLFLRAFELMEGSLTEPDNETALREALVESYRYLAANRLTDLSSGNVSCRLGDRVLISPRGATAQTIDPAAVVAAGLDGLPLGPGSPSSELPMHLAIYRKVPEVAAIVHTHSDHCVALASCGLGIPGFHYLVGGFGGDDIPCVPYATFGSETLAELAADALVRRRACLLANHGAICHGRDIESATIRAHRLEILARQYLLARQAGTPGLLSRGDWDGYRAMVRMVQYE